MSTITLEIPDRIAQRLRAHPDAERLASEAIIDALQREATFAALGRPLRPFAEYSSEAAYVAAESAPAFGVDPDLAASLAEGNADSEQGRTLSLNDAKAKWEEQRKSGRQ